MSGARALASARRRRAGAPENNQPRNPPPIVKPVPLSSSNNDMGSAFDMDTSPPAPKKMTPAAMLLNHNKVIDNLQQVVTNLDKSFVAHQHDMEEKMASFTLDDNNIEYFKQKVKDLEIQLREIKRHILKVQTFAMETNTQCMEMKKKMNNEVNVVSNDVQMKSAEEISNVLLEENEISSA